jgi:mannitol-specific phosphotransferase system IIBC component
VLWALAALATLGVALAQSLPMFLASFAAVTFGTYTALWLVGGLARR